jgi:outer membrane receptor protein involved in Fe transport
VVVTASKRPEELKDIPMAISVLGQDQLDRLNARSFEDFVNNVPGMNLVETSPTHPQIILRGINAGGVGATVGTYLDETPWGSSSGLANGTDTAPNLDTFDMERVEVLRGPQGTLYGSSTLGGLLKFVTNAPDPSGFAAQFEAGGTTIDSGSTGGFARAMVNVPISDDSAIRLVGFDSHDAGWVDDPALNKKNTNGTTSYGGRAEVLFQPSNNFTVRFNFLTQKLEAGDTTDEDVVVTGNTFHPLFGSYEHARTTNEPSSSLYRLSNMTLNWNWDWAVLTSVTSYGMYNDRLLEDGTGIYGTDINATLGVNKFTQELRLASEPNEGPVDWLVGGYYTHEVATLVQRLVGIGNLQLDSRYVETAGFANVTYHFNDRFDISGGGRYSSNGQGSNEFGLGALAKGTSSESVFTWSGAAHYKLDDETSLYARVAKGYRPGGPNLIPLGVVGVPGSFSSDSLIDYEAGVKSDLLDGRLSLDADIFYIDWSNIQLLTVINNTGVDANGGSARSYGAEWNAQWQPVDNLILGWSGAYTDATLTADTPAIVGGQSGDELPWAAKWTSTLSGDYRFASTSAWTPYIGGSWRYVGRRYSDFQAGTSQLPLAAYSGFDAHIGIDWRQWELEVYGKNLSSAKGVTEYSASGTSAASGNAASVSLIAPRLIGVVLRAKF